MMDIIVKYDTEFMKSGAVFYDGAVSYGGAGNVAVDASTLGLKTSMVAKVGRDPLGRLFMDDLLKHNVVPQLAFDDVSYTGFLVSLLHQDSERSFLVCRGANDKLSPKDIDKAFEGARPRIVFIQGYGIASPQRRALLYAARKARDFCATVIYDPASYNIVQAHRNFVIDNLMRYVDICLPNLEEAKALTGRSDLESMGRTLAGLVPLAIVKLGADGAAIVPRGEEISYYKPQRVKPTNTTGAGDAFASAIIYGLSKGFSHDLTMKIANWVAAKKIQSLDSRLTIERRQFTKFRVGLQRDQRTRR